MKYDSKFIGSPVKIVGDHPWKDLVGVIAGTVGNDSYQVALDPHHIKPDRIIPATFLKLTKKGSA